ncbi:MAG: hypothetical protein HFH32_11655 [Eubacterium sp.]|jgi:hypothetical protein|nr:hypothetical protein [Eubacterium sp.]
MEDMNSEFQMNGMNRLKELFAAISENSGYNLDRYISGQSLTVSGDNEGLMRHMKEFLAETQEAVKKDTDIKSLITVFQNEGRNDKFIEWLEGFLYDSIRPYQDAEYLRKTDLEQFQQVSEYVFEHMILTNIDNEYIETEIADGKQLRCIRKIFMTFINRIVCYNDRKEYIIDNMERRFGLDEEKCGFWWNLVKENEDRLWKIMVMRKMNFIENKLSRMLELIEE